MSQHITKEKSEKNENCKKRRIMIGGHIGGETRATSERRRRMRSTRGILRIAAFLNCAITVFCLFSMAVGSSTFYIFHYNFFCFMIFLLFFNYKQTKFWRRFCTIKVILLFLTKTSNQFKVFSSFSLFFSPHLGTIKQYHLPTLTNSI